jgi:hypothetical protein
MPTMSLQGCHTTQPQLSPFNHTSKRQHFITAITSKKCDMYQTKQHVQLMLAIYHRNSAYLYSENFTASWGCLDCFLELYRVSWSGNRGQSHILGGQTGTSDLIKCNHTICRITNLAVEITYRRGIIQMLYDSPCKHYSGFWRLMHTCIHSN